MPTWLARIVGVFPVKALTDALRAGYDPAAHVWPLRSLLILVVWAVLGVVVARRYFRWDPA